MIGHHTIVGLPGSGKTTFLAALWHLMTAGEAKSSLVLDELVGDHRHLDAIVEHWQRCEEVPRTSMASEEQVVIRVRSAVNDQRATVQFPDVSGESFERQVSLRQCSLDYVQRLNTGGIVLFVTANRRQDGMRVRDIDYAAGVDEQSSPGISGTAWTPEFIPEQVRLVELLQFVHHPPFSRRRRRLAVMVSAWDVLPNPKPTPERWVERELPLLHQYLTSNGDKFNVRFYGVSAQGGEFIGEGRDRLLRLVPSERIECVGPGEAGHDLSAPVLWLMDGD